MVQTEQTSRTHQTDVKVTCHSLLACSLRPRRSHNGRRGAADTGCSVSSALKERASRHDSMLKLELSVMFNMTETLSERLYTLRSVTTVVVFFLLFLFWSQSVMGVKTSHQSSLKSQMLMCVYVCVFWHASSCWQCCRSPASLHKS